jgi:hypothetical protein
MPQDLAHCFMHFNSVKELCRVSVSDPDPHVSTFDKAYGSGSGSRRSKSSHDFGKSEARRQINHFKKPRVTIKNGLKSDFYWKIISFYI